ncbi:SET domain group 40 [Perilla frutescens var. hirtella]|uniref:SET domain group 40 n=1 Tax=Perilla frutescens var. hirtella TaxID=608512 RepID=A0AAD4J534_PERFH|nr:SET domain group 40 [Perilla frutescens var. hirtella]
MRRRPSWALTTAVKSKWVRLHTLYFTNTLTLPINNWPTEEVVCIGEIAFSLYCSGAGTLVWEQGKSSWWYPYLKQLPQSYDLLESFGQLEIEALQIDDAIWIAGNVVQKFKMKWKEATPLLSELNLKPQFTTFNAWLWASATSRAQSLMALVFRVSILERGSIS